VAATEFAAREPVTPGPAAPELIAPGLAALGPAAPEPTAPGPAALGPAASEPAAAANRAASTPLGMTVAVMPQPSASSAATAAETQTCAVGVVIARSWQAASSGVVKWSMWCTVRRTRA
jgi:hypothetical protein